VLLVCDIRAIFRSSRIPASTNSTPVAPFFQAERRGGVRLLPRELVKLCAKVPSVKVGVVKELVVGELSPPNFAEGTGSRSLGASGGNNRFDRVPDLVRADFSEA